MLIEDTLLTPIACKFCDADSPTDFVTYIELDLVLHLHEAHNIGRGYLDTPPTPSTPSSSWSDDYRIRDAINEGKEIGAELDQDSLEKLDLEYSKYLEKASPQISTHEGNIMEGVRPWSLKNSFMPVVSVDEFFKDDADKPYSALGNHSLEQSPCYPIIGSKPAGRHILYYCEICHPEFANINLSSIEHHCKYRDPDCHKVEIISRLALRSKVKSATGEQMNVA